MRKLYLRAVAPFLVAFLVASCAHVEPEAPHRVGASYNGGGGGGTTIAGDTWAAAASQFIQRINPRLTECRTVYPGTNPVAATASTSSANVTGTEGSGLGATGASIVAYTPFVYTVPLTGAYGYAWHGILPVPVSGKTGYFALANFGASHALGLASAFATSTTKWVLTGLGYAAFPGAVNTTMNADGNEHDFVITYDATATTPTIALYVDGVLQASVTDRTNVIDEAMQLGAYGSTFAGAGVVVSAIRYCFVPHAPFAYNNVCTYPDGSSQPGSCMWNDEFTGAAVDATKWFVAGSNNPPTFTDVDSAILQAADNTGCVAAANATVSGGVLSMAVSANSRGSGGCLASWVANSTYNTNYPSYPLGGTTSWDTAWVSQATFSFTYGYVSANIQMPGGSGPGGDFTLQGTNCQSPNGSIGASMAGPIFTGGAGACSWPGNAPEIDVVEYATGNTTMDSSIYVGNAVGSPPLVGTIFTPPVSYYGNQFGGIGLAYLSGFTISNPTTTKHIYAVDWRPGSITWYFDGHIVASKTATYVPTVPMSVYMFSQNLTTTTVGGTMQVKNVRITCPAGVPCVINHAMLACDDRVAAYA